MSHPVFFGYYFYQGLTQNCLKHQTERKTLRIMSTPSSTLGKFFHGLAKLYRGFRAIILNLVFIIIVLLGIGSMLGQPPVVVETGSALLLNSEGTLVDQLTFVDPLNVLMSDSLGDTTTGEILLRDLLAAIEFAATDNDISSI